MWKHRIMYVLLRLHSQSAMQVILIKQQGCVYYRPPDVHLGNIDYGTEYDIWSLGCM